LDILADDFPVNLNSLIKSFRDAFPEEDKIFIKIFVLDYGVTYDRVP